MLIRVKSFADLRAYTTHLPSDGELAIDDGTTVETVLKKLAVPADTNYIILVNGRHQNQRYVLQPGDDLVFFSPIEGG